MNIIDWEGHTFRISNVTAEVVDLDGEQVLKVERDLASIPFDEANLAHSVDEPTYVSITDLDMGGGIVEVKVRSRIQRPLAFASPQGFIGMVFRVGSDDRAFESIYLRPNVGRSRDQLARNHAVQYFAYPDYKFTRLREEANGRYETWADIGLDEWITMRIEFDGREAVLYLNDHPRPAFLVNTLLGSTTTGSIGLYVDIGTIGYFKDLRLRRITRTVGTV